MAEKRYLSRTHIATFCGNVMPLRLLGGEEYGMEKITWQTDDPSIVKIAGFSKNYPTGGEFTDGVLLTFLAPGKAAVTAKHGENTYTCSLEIHEMRHAAPGEPLQYFVGDMHDHTWSNHKPAEFSNRPPEFYPINHYIKKMKADGKMDFAAISDHADIMNARERFELHNLLMSPTGETWQRMVSRLELYGPISKEIPASICRLGKGVCYVSEAIAKPFGSWYNGIKFQDM